MHIRVMQESKMPRLKIDSDLLGTSRAAAYLGVHRSTLASWRRRNVVPCRVVETPHGIRYRFVKETLDQFKEQIDYDA